MTQTYRVRSGDNLRLIAKFHQSTVSDLLAMNPQIENEDVIFVGQIINVPETPEEGESIHAALVSGDGPKWYQIAFREMESGVDEISGPQDNPRIVEYHQATSLRATDDETPWCSSFVNWCMMKAAIQRTNSAAARSWLNWGVELENPQLGCVVVFERTSNPTAGHVGFYHGEHNGRILLLGGNQSNQVSISPQSKDKWLGYRWPSDADSN